MESFFTGHCTNSLVFSRGHAILVANMELQAISGQLHLIEGEIQEGPAVPGLLVQPAPARSARGREHDLLFVHLTLTGRLEETAVLIQDLLDSISHSYYRATGSVTSALRRAVIEANEALLRLNLSGAGVVREGAITCAVLRGGELFTLQVGEGLAFLGHNFGVERLPPKPPDRIVPLGRSAGLDFRYYHHRLQTGDMLLLADPRLAHLPTQSFALALVDTEVELGLAELQQLVRPESARLLLVEFTDEVLLDLPEATGTGRAASSFFGKVLQPRPKREGLQAGQAGRQTTVSPQPGSTAVEKSARKATAEAAMGLSRFSGWLAELLETLRPLPDPDEKAIKWPVPTALAILIPLMVTLIVMGVYFQWGQVRRLADLKQEMGHSLVLAEENQAEDGARRYYNQILALADEAEQIRPGDSEVNRLRNQAMMALDRLDDVTRLSAQPYHRFGPEARLGAVVLRPGFNGGIYTLDQTSSAVYEHRTDESYTTPQAEPIHLAVSGQVPAGNYVVNSFIDMMWRPRGQAVTREGLAMLDVSGMLLMYLPTTEDYQLAPLDLASEWRQPVAIATYSERLYILDRGMQQIWKYFPDEYNFVLRADDQAIGFNDDPELAQAVDLDLYSEDASLVVLYEDGRIRYYDTRSGRVQWDESDLAQSGLSSPLIGPNRVKLVGRGLNASIFISDPGSGRIIQVSRGGTVLAQYRASDELGQDLFTRITDFDVAETPLRVFVTADNVLYLATSGR
jgi:hypothetical protein